MSDLSTFARNKHSQAGEDGILEEIFVRLGVTQGIFCEFGAWDGQHLSNCFGFYEKGWGGWYIEGRADRFRDLQRNITEARIENICSYVQPDGQDSLDSILTRSRLFAEGVTEIDLLSIDIDSDDLALWRGIKAFRPKVVIIEFNPTIPSDVYFENTRGKNQGNSPLSIYEYAKTIDYRLVSVVGVNLIFLDGRLDSDIPNVDLVQGMRGQRFFFAYDGTLIMTTAGPNSEASAPEFFRIPWSGSVFPQPADKFFRHYDPERWRREAMRVWCDFKMFFTNPLTSIRRLFR